MQKLKFIENQFLTATKGSSKAMLTIIADHSARMQSGATHDPDFIPWAARTAPVAEEMSAAYANHQGARGTYQGATHALRLALIELRKKKVPKWDVHIQLLYMEGTPDYARLFGMGRMGFQSGGIDMIITRVKSLGSNLASEPALAAIKAEVDAYYAHLKSLREQQQSKEGALAASRDRMEKARVAAAWMCFRNMGQLMDKYWDRLQYVDNYYEFHLIKQKRKKKDAESTKN